MPFAWVGGCKGGFVMMFFHIHVTIPQGCQLEWKRDNVQAGCCLTIVPGSGGGGGRGMPNYSTNVLDRREISPPAHPCRMAIGACVARLIEERLWFGKRRLEHGKIKLFN